MLRIRGKDQLSLKNFFVDAKRIGVIEGRIADHHFKDEDAQGPPIDLLAMAISSDDFGRQILGRPTKGPSLVGNKFGKAKVRDFNVALAIKQQVLRLEVSIHDVPGVKILEGKDDFCGIKACRIQGKFAKTT